MNKISGWLLEPLAILHANGPSTLACKLLLLIINFI